MPVYLALAAGFLLFFAYGLLKRVSASALLKAAVGSVKSVAVILIAFLLIGMLTASWRASGTIAGIVSACMGLVNPAVFPMATFLMVSLMSVLTGTAFGSAATMGSICMAVGQALGCDSVLIGGAILGGAFVGDRCSPLSTSAILTATVTGTKLMDNLPRMAKRAALPMLATCGIYLALGFMSPASGQGTVVLPYNGVFDLSWPVLLPAVSVVVLAVLKVDVRVNMAVSIVVAVVIALILQQASAADLAYQLVFGYVAPTAEAAKTLNGGGLLSMVDATLIILISGTYAGLFEQTHLLEGIQQALVMLAGKIGREIALVISGFALCGLCCNQTLSTILGEQLFRGLYKGENQALALDIADTLIVSCALIPWCIAATVPLGSVGAPLASICCAFYLLLQPASVVFRAVFKNMSGKRYQQ